MALDPQPAEWRIPSEFEMLTPWLLRVAELWGPEESFGYIKTLSKEDLKELEVIRSLFARMEWRRSAEDWYESVPIPDKHPTGTRTMLYLANLLDRLGQLRVKPFADYPQIEFAQRIRIKPQDMADWPEEFADCKELALKYGRLHGEQALIDQIVRLTPSQRRKLCTIKQRLFHGNRLMLWLNDKANHAKKYHPILYSFGLMLDHLDCPNRSVET